MLLLKGLSLFKNCIKKQAFIQIMIPHTQTYTHHLYTNISLIFSYNGLVQGLKYTFPKQIWALVDLDHYVHRSWGFVHAQKNYTDGCITWTKENILLVYVQDCTGCHYGPVRNTNEAGYRSPNYHAHTTILIWI